ncbi:hypothetical protein BD289DRAFT_366527 [Coniella lustricola]|uniref:F-box domain-containing protein n=1 Tax=Coniella lustricola TaxID=2025994 RepID=A0A2T3AAR4_9PEZI|nr:hypothetical protein BD289DRAFT_366527 [Coniella lustricola]
MDYEPPSPSYPYTEEHESQDSDSSAENANEHLDLNQNPTHLSEIYSQDAVSGADFDQDLSIISEYLRSKDCGWDQLTPRTAPLNLLALPLDVLRLIVKEIKHTNDLTSLALTNSTLHSLATPHIYSRFDIVWPDGPATPNEAKSVDALTYGLSTLCLGSSFARVTRRARGDPKISSGPLAKLSGNDYAKYTRKFSLGNGPKTWVSEYAITKESGKMLGTLVAMAISKMVNLETFIWDMPTGVLSDIFMALASLSDTSETNQCMLERVWIRWHDNSDPDGLSSSVSSPIPINIPSAVVPAGSTLTPVGVSLPSTAAHPTPKPAISYADNHVEYPTFSVLPPLKSLTVLDIDELAYLDEMAMLIERSVDTLQELRVGISSKALYHDFVQTWDGTELEQVDHNARWPGESTIGERRLGGVLGVLLGRIYDIRRKPNKLRDSSPSRAGENMSTTQSSQLISSGGAPLPKSGQQNAAGSETNSSVTEADTAPMTEADPRSVSTSTSDAADTAASADSARERLDGKLKVATLELERVPLSMQVCNKAFDWKILTNLTILDCPQHENLWKMLRKQFQPQPRVSGYGISPNSSKPVPNAPLQYALSLKWIHTDITSPALIAFIRETLAPNSLESLFLQDRRRSSSSSTANAVPIVSIDTIFKGAIKPHRSSLRRLLLDSSSKKFSSGPSSDTPRWRAWCLPSNILYYITSGRMSNLRELAVSLDYKNWHTFLQRLPNIPQLRSLHFPFVGDHSLSKQNPKELVLQITDILTIRPEIQICYVGIMDKCFEILENRPSDPVRGARQNITGTPTNLADGDAGTPHAPVIVGANGDENDTPDDFENDGHADDDDDNDNDDDDDDSQDDEGISASPVQHEDAQSDHSYNDSDDDSFVETPPAAHLRLREILFYDDKVAIFKARHGRL